MIRRALTCLLVAGMALPALAQSGPASAAGSTTGVTLESLTSDGIGQSYVRLSPEFSFSTGSAASTLVFGTDKPGRGTTSLTLSTPSGQTTFAPGSYVLASSAGTDRAGIVLAGASDCAKEGALAVHDVGYSGVSVTTFAATFQVRCVGASTYAYGEIRYLAGLPLLSVSATLTQLDLGSSPVGQATSSSAMGFRNSGSAAITPGAARITGADAPDFVIVDDQCANVSVPPGSTCSVTVRATPSAGGQRDAVVELPSSVARGFTRTPVLVRGVSAPDAPTSLLARSATNGVLLTFKAPTTGDAATSYQVLRGTTTDSLAPIGTTTQLTYGDQLSPTTASGTSYVYAVRGVNAAGRGPQSSTATASTPASQVNPTATRVIVVDRAASASSTGIDSISANNDGFSLPGPIGYAPAPGTTLATGTFPIDVDNGRMDLPGCAPWMSNHGSITITQVLFDVAGTLQVLDADASLTCGSGETLSIAIRYGADRAYTAVVAPDVNAGSIPAGTTADAVATYTNSGTSTVSLSGVAVSGSAWSLGTDNTCTSATLDPTQSCHVAVRVLPVRSNNVGSITFTDSSPRGSHTRALNALGIVAPPAISITSAMRTAGKVSLGWQIEVDDTTRPTSFRVYRGPDAGHLALLTTIPAVAGYFQGYTDPDTADGTRAYAVQGVNDAGAGPDGPAYLVDAATRPVTGLSGAAAAAKAALEWVAPTSLANDPLTGYVVYRGATSGALTRLATVTTTAWTGPAPAPGEHAYFAISPLYGDVVGPRSAAIDLVGTATQLLVARDKGIAAIPTAGGPSVPFLPDGYPHPDLAVSPNGAWLAYANVYYSPAGAQRSLVMQRTDGSSTSTPFVASSTADEYSPSWSPDGRQVAYARDDVDGVTICRTAVTSTGGGACVPVTSHDAYDEPSWLDASTLVVSDFSSNGAPLAKLTTAGVATPIPGTEGGYTPVVSPDGTQVAYLVPGATDFSERIKVVDLATGAVRTLPTPGSTMFSPVSWSRDSSALYVAGGTDTSSRVYQIGTAPGGTATTVAGTEGVHAVAVDTPDTVAPVNVTLAGVPAVTLGAAVTPTFSASDALNKIASYSLSYRRAAYNGGYSAPTVKVLTKATAIAVAKGYSYCFSVRATDRAGNTSAATPEQCVMVPLDDRSLARSSGFAPVASSAYFAGTAMKATGRGQTLTRTGMTALRQLTVVATACPTCGTADVLVAGRKVGAVNLASRTTVNRKAFTLPVFSVRSGTVQLTVTSTGRTVVIDGLGFRK